LNSFSPSGSRQFSHLARADRRAPRIIPLGLTREKIFLLAESQALDQGPIAVGRVFPEILELLSPLSDHFQQSPPGMVILPVSLQVLSQALDPPGQKRNLHFRRTGVLFVNPERFDDPLLGLC
jgi:hypothetical protein